MWVCKRDLSKECEGNYKDCTNCVLDNILADLMKLQTYKMFEGEDTVYVVRDDVLKALEQQLRDCKTCKHSDKGNCAYTEECHECMWGSKYKQQSSEDCISRQAIKEILSEEWTKYMPMELDINLSFVLEKISELPSVTPKLKIGKWINQYQIYGDIAIDMKVCSECRYEFSYDAETGISNANYCPNCGARMEVEK